MRKCDLSQVPTKKNDTRVIYDWSKAIGLKIPFEYDGLKDFFEIINYESRDKVYIKYNDKTNMLYGKYIRKGKIAKIFDEEIDWKYHIGENIQYNKKGYKTNITITAKYYSKDNPDFKKGYERNYKWYQYKCNVCGYDCTMDNFWINEIDLKDGKGCSCCAGIKVIKGVNDISTTASDLMVYLVDKEFGYTHTKTTNKSTLMRCPICGYEKNMQFQKVYFQNFACPYCSDGFSYPEKFLMHVLDKSNIAFKYQLSKSDFNWCDKYKYDFYLPDYNWIIETHGMQHYEDKWCKISLQQKIDKKKKELAVANKIDKYIELDCRYSTKDYIKKSIKESVLNTIIHDIDYDEIDLLAQKSILKEVCLFYDDNRFLTYKQIAQKFNISHQTVYNYIRKGKELGIIK